MQHSIPFFFSTLVLGLVFIQAAPAQTSDSPSAKTVPLALAMRTLHSLPFTVENGDTAYLRDFRHTDCSQLDLSGSFNLLLASYFDSKTVWPKTAVPEYFRPELIAAFSANPGCTVRHAAAKGATGRGQSIVIIGPPLLTGHEEYRHRLASYTPFTGVRDTATVDGTAWASITVGKTSGIAFDATLHYMAVPHRIEGGNPVYESAPVLSALKASRAIIATDGAEGNIAALAMPYDIDSTGDLWPEIEAELEFIRGRGTAVFTSGPAMFGEGTRTVGLGRDPLRNPDDFLFWRPARYWLPDLDAILHSGDPALFLPVESRYLASPTGLDDYAFYRDPSPRWLAPFAAACYTVAADVRHGIAMKEFWRIAQENGVAVEFEAGGASYEIDSVLHLAATIEKLRQLNKLD